MYRNQPQNFQRIIVEGNIGAGKSTFLRLLQQHFSAQFVFEPHERWQNIDGHNLLDAFYADPKRWAYTFQSYTFITRLQADAQAALTSTSPFHILERSIYSDRYCFAQNCFEMGVISAMEWKMYQEWFDWLAAITHFKPNGFIYLRTDPVVCFERMQKRNRSEETGVSLAYLTTIHEKHEQWLVKKEGIMSSLQNVPVLILECNHDFEGNALELQKHFDAIEAFFNIPLKKNEKNAQK